MENLDIGQIINLNEDYELLKAKVETLKAEVSIEETLRKAFSKDLTPKIVSRKERYKRINGVKVPYSVVTIYETQLNDYIEIANSQAQINGNYKDLKSLGEKLKRETSQSAIYQRYVEAEAEIKRLKMENMLLEAKVKDRDREIAEIYTQGAEPYIDYEEQTFDLEI